MKSIGGFAAVVPGKYSTAGNNRLWETVVHEPVHQVDGVTHPLIGNPAREFFVKTKLKIHLRIEGPRGLGHQPGIPIRVLFANLFHLGTAAPARTVIVPDDFDLAHISERSAARDFLRRTRVGLAAMLGADLDDGLRFKDSVARGFSVTQHIAHRLFDISVFPRLGRHFEDWRMRMLRGRDQYTVDILH